MNENPGNVDSDAARAARQQIRDRALRQLARTRRRDAEERRTLNTQDPRPHGTNLSR